MSLFQGMFCANMLITILQAHLMGPEELYRIKPVTLKTVIADC